MNTAHATGAAILTYFFLLTLALGKNTDTEDAFQLFLLFTLPLFPAICIFLFMI